MIQFAIKIPQVCKSCHHFCQLSPRSSSFYIPTPHLPRRENHGKIGRIQRHFLTHIIAKGSLVLSTLLDIIVLKPKIRPPTPLLGPKAEYNLM